MPAKFESLYRDLNKEVWQSSYFANQGLCADIYLFGYFMYQRIGVELGCPDFNVFQYFCGQLRCMTALKLAVVQKRTKNMRQTQAEEFRQKCLTKRAWHSWLLKCEECEELRLFHLTKRAQSHYRYNNTKYCEEMIFSESRKEED
mgnify:CR=1 FL=1